MILSLVLDVYKMFLLIDFKIRKKALKYFMVAVAFTLINTSASLLLVVEWKKGAAGRMAGPMISSFLIAIFFMLSYRKKLKFKLDWKLVAEGLKFSWPMLLSAYFYLPMANLDKIFVERIGNLNELGYYSIGYNNALYLSMAGKSLMNAFEPDFIRYIINKSYKRLLQSTLVYSVSLTTVTILFILVSKHIVDFLTSGRYTRAYIYANYNAVAFFFMNMAQVPNSFIIALRKSKSMLYINIISGLLGIFLYKFLIEKWEYLGGVYARIAVSFSYLITQVIFVYFFLKKRNNIEES